MNEVKKDDDPRRKGSNESKFVSMDSKMDEIVAILKNIDDKLAIIVRVVQEINRRG